MKSTYVCNVEQPEEEPLVPVAMRFDNPEQRNANFAGQEDVASEPSEEPLVAPKMTFDKE